MHVSVVVLFEQTTNVWLRTYEIDQVYDLRLIEYNTNW